MTISKYGNVIKFSPIKIPAWLKEELAHSEKDLNDDNEADVSDYEPGSNFHPDASMTSIHINKNLKRSGRMAPASKLSVINLTFFSN